PRDWERRIDVSPPEWRYRGGDFRPSAFGTGPLDLKRAITEYYFAQWHRLTRKNRAGDQRLLTGRRPIVVCCGQSAGLARGNLDRGEDHRAVIALEHQRAGRDLLARQPAGRRALHLDVLVDDLVVERHLDELGIAGLFPAHVETGRAEVDDELLPLARLLRGVHLRRRRPVEPAEITRADLLLAVAVEDLHLVLAHDVYTRV